MIKAEWKNFFSHPKLLVTMFAASFIPLMYAGFFLGGVWDPYGQTEHLPVAVVSSDKGATIGDKPVNIGDEVVKKLRSNDALDWRFVDAETAERGMNDGQYYMLITIPENFSKNAATIRDDNPQKSVIDFETTPAKNYVGSMISRTSATKLEQEAKTALTTAYSEALLAGLSDAEDGFSAASSGADQLGQGGRQLTGGLQTLSGALPTDAQLSQLNAGLDRYGAGISQLNSTLNNFTLNQKLVSADARADLVAAHLAELDRQLAAINPAEIEQTITVLEQVIATNPNLPPEQKLQLEQTIEGLQAKVQQFGGLKAARDQLASAQRELTQIHEATASVRQLQSATSQLDSSFGQLSGATKQALGGYTQVRSATNQLADGSLKLEQGNFELSTKLAEAANQLAIQPKGEDTARHIADPMSTSETKRGNVPNYGHALAPYVMSLALYIGAVVFNLLYPVRKLFATPHGGFTWWLAKASVATFISFLQATIVGLATIWILGLQPDSFWHYMMMLQVTSLAYMAIVTFLSMTLDNVGRFLSLLLLVVQLGGSEGTFPIELSSGFFQAVHPYLPMSHSVAALREAISGGMSVGVFWQNFWLLVGVTVVASVLLIIILALRHDRKFKHDVVTE